MSRDDHQPDEAYAADLGRLRADLAGEMKDFARWVGNVERGALPRPAPGSELSNDAEVLGALEAYPLLSGSHLSAANHMRAFRDSLLKTETVYASASITTLRGALEPAALALWMVQPDDRPERVKRALRTHYDNLDEFRKYKNAKGVTEDAAELAESLCDLREFANTILGSETGLGRPDTTDVLRVVAGADAEGLWRITSGIAHGVDWTKLEGFYTSATRASGRPTPGLYLLPDLDLIRRLTRTVHQLYTAALTTYRARAAAESRG